MTGLTDIRDRTDYGADDTTATYRAPDADPCGELCSNSWHGSRDLGLYGCTPCQLPTGHKAAHWTACRPSPKVTS